MVEATEALEEVAEGFKLTELGPLPEEWQVVRLGELVSSRKLFIKNGFPQGAHNQGGKGVPHLRPFNVSEDGNIALSQAKYVEPPSPDSPWWVRRGDVIFNNTNSEELVGKTAYFEHDGAYVLSNHMTIVRVLDAGAIDGYWLSKEFYYLWTLGLFGSLCRRHVNQASVSLERLKGVTFPLPPLEEQRAIAHVLSTVQRAIEGTERVIAAAREFKRSLMRHLFTYGPVPLAEAERVPLKETEIGPLPEHWRLVRLADVTERTRQVDPVRNPRERFMYVDVSAVSSESLRIQTVTEYPRGEAPSRARKIVAKGDIIFATVRPYLKRVAMVDTNLDGHVCSTAFCVVRCNQHDALPRFMFYALSDDGFIGRVSQHQSGSSYPAVTDKQVLSELVPLPSLSEQRDIGCSFQATDCKIEAEEKRKAALKELFRTMLHLLMTGQVRVRDFAATAEKEES